jgi:hypothetical protein
MAGNVSEWRLTSPMKMLWFEHDLNPDIRYDAQPNDPITMKRKVIRKDPERCSIFLSNRNPPI